MKLIITESKYTLVVKSYLDSLYTPDGGFDKTISFNGPLLPVIPNQGPYAPLQSSVLTSGGLYLNILPKYILCYLTLIYPNMILK